MQTALIMTKEDKILLIKCLCEGLPYGLHVQYDGSMSRKLDKLFLTHFYNGGSTVTGIGCDIDFFCSGDYSDVERFKPYLRPMGSMTDEEKGELCRDCHVVSVDIDKLLAGSDRQKCDMVAVPNAVRVTDWLNARHFDHRGLIGKGIATEAPDWLY